MSDGPTFAAITYQSCSNCTHHDQRMWRSGDFPVYHHFCRHPAVKAARKVPWPQEQHGEFIGETDRTPKWCPFLAPKDER